MYYLKREFFKNPKWSQKKINNIALQVNLSPTNVYKWRWDYEKRMGFKEYDDFVKKYNLKLE